MTKIESNREMALRTAGDIESWVNRTINEIGEEPGSIARANTRIACMNTLLNLKKITLAYMELADKGKSTRALENFIENKVV